MTTPRSILLLPMCGIGDAVCYLPVLDLLRSRFPEAAITTIVATGGAASILSQTASGAEILVFNRGAGQRGWRSVFRLLWSIRRRRYDVVISGAHPDSTRVPLFAWLSGARMRIGAGSERLAFLYNRRVRVAASAHYFERYRTLLTPLGIDVHLDEYRPRLTPPVSARASALRIWQEAGLNGADCVVGFASGADTNARGAWKPFLKRWSTRGYAEVARWVHKELRGRVVMFGSHEEQPFAAEIQALSGVPIVNLCGKVSLDEVQWLIARCHVFVSNDTGTMHMAGALGTEVVALFGPTSPASFHPPGESFRIVQGHASCAPCYPHPTCGLSSCVAMQDVDAARIIDQISQSLPAHNAGAALQER